MIRVQFVSLLHGHEPMEWDPNVPGELKKMKEWFIEKLSVGFRAFAFKGKGPGKLITKFDEEAERIVLTSDRIKVVPTAYGG